MTNSGCAKLKLVCMVTIVCDILHTTKADSVTFCICTDEGYIHPVCTDRKMSSNKTNEGETVVVQN